MLELEYDEENQETYFEPEDIVDNDEMWRTSDDDIMPSDIEVHRLLEHLLRSWTAPCDRPCLFPCLSAPNSLVLWRCHPASGVEAVPLAV